MKKYIFIISAFVLVLLLPGCEKEFNGLVEPGESIYKVEAVQSFDEVYYGLQDSTIQLWIQLKNDNDVSSVTCELLDPDGDKLEGSPVSLVRSEGKYAGVYTLSYAQIVGQYTINYYVTDAASGSNLVASHFFDYDNGQANVAPVLSNLVMADTLTAGQTIIYSVEAKDENGLKDIVSVFYEAYNPDGKKIVNSEGFSQFPMFDNGTQGGDVVARDGKFTVTLKFPASVQKGTWRFEFTAEDRRGLLSEKIIHNLVVK